MAGFARINVVINNGRGFRALQRSILLARELHESQPWNSEAKRLLKQLRIVAKEMRPEKAK